MRPLSSEKHVAQTGRAGWQNERGNGDGDDGLDRLGSVGSEMASRSFLQLLSPRPPLGKSQE